MRTRRANDAEARVGAPLETGDRRGRPGRGRSPLCCEPRLVPALRL